jgi:hypothetical protein
MATDTAAPTRGYTATQDQLVKRLRRKLMAAVARVTRRG